MKKIRTLIVLFFAARVLVVPAPAGNGEKGLLAKPMWEMPALFTRMLMGFLLASS